mmetsp:Transcript_81841/g.245402  ORF Transcript_81841/g.245402 Transcript_81841/m.245402 type:complete len:210 (-) Transcript_81841:557-1186(-)
MTSRSRSSRPSSVQRIAFFASATASWSSEMSTAGLAQCSMQTVMCSQYSHESGVLQPCLSCSRWRESTSVCGLLDAERKPTRNSAWPREQSRCSRASRSWSSRTSYGGRAIVGFPHTGTRPARSPPVALVGAIDGATEPESENSESEDEPSPLSPARVAHAPESGAALRDSASYASVRLVCSERTSGALASYGTASTVSMHPRSSADGA